METLITLPYGSLSPVIGERTLEFHHGKHLATYVSNLNKAIEGSPLQALSLEQLIVKASSEGLTPVFNNAGQVFNHNMYFQQFTPCPSVRCEESPLSSAIDAAWGTFESFREKFNAAGASIFGSGWVWLQADGVGKLSIGRYSGADNPVSHGLRPVLTFDVWEHAYYLDYQNRRPAYLDALWKIVDWNVVEGRYSLYEDIIDPGD